MEHVSGIWAFGDWGSTSVCVVFLGALWDLTKNKCLRDTEAKRGLGDVLLLEGAGLQQTETEGARDYGLHAKKKKRLNVLVRNLHTQL